MADWAKSGPEFSDKGLHKPFLWCLKPPEGHKRDLIIELLFCFQHNKSSLLNKSTISSWLVNSSKPMSLDLMAFCWFCLWVRSEDWEIQLYRNRDTQMCIGQTSICSENCHPCKHRNQQAPKLIRQLSPNLCFVTRAGLEEKASVCITRWRIAEERV